MNYNVYTINIDWSGGILRMMTMKLKRMAFTYERDEQQKQTIKTAAATIDNIKEYTNKRIDHLYFIVTHSKSSRKNNNKNRTAYIQHLIHFEI